MTQPSHNVQFKSIQGEREEGATLAIYADPADVDNYVDSHGDGVVRCRERGRHDYPTIREAGLDFEGINDLGLHVRRVRCRSCDLVDLVEEWDVVHSKGLITRCERVSGRPDYAVHGPDGERYLGKIGHGRMTPKMVRNSVATKALKGHSFKELRKATLSRSRRQGETE